MTLFHPIPKQFNNHPKIPNHKRTTHDELHSFPSFTQEEQHMKYAKNIPRQRKKKLFLKHVHFFGNESDENL